MFSGGDYEANHFLRDRGFEVIPFPENGEHIYDHTEENISKEEHDYVPILKNIWNLNILSKSIRLQGPI